MADIVMPRLSDSMEEGTVLQWLKAVGDEVAVGDELVEIETDKANMAYESDVAGTLSEILVQEGETVAIGTPIARVGDSDGAQQDEQVTMAATAGPVVGVGCSPCAALCSGQRDGAGVGMWPCPPQTPRGGDHPTLTPPAEDSARARPEARAAAKKSGSSVMVRPIVRAGSLEAS